MESLMKPGIYWYRGPIQTAWDPGDQWGATNDWIVIGVAHSGIDLSGTILGTEANLWPEDLERMEREGTFVEITRPAPQE
jgi:hypothetical protein